MDALDDDARALRALKLAARDAYVKHKALGVPIATWKDGAVVLIPPEDIVIPDLPE